jgi:hypothetical protein
MRRRSQLAEAIAVGGDIIDWGRDAHRSSMARAPLSILSRAY